MGILLLISIALLLGFSGAKLINKLNFPLIFAALAPAGTWVVLREYKAKGPLTDTILAVVGLDDALAIVIYGLAAGVAVGLAILVGREFGGLGIGGHNLALLAINTVAATIIIFEIIVPLITKIAVIRSGEAGRSKRRAI